MQKWLPGIVATLLIPTCVLGAGTLYDTYLQSTGRFPTLIERAKSALECGIVSTAAQYTGSQKQNTLLNTCLTASGAFGGLVTRPNSYSPGTIIRSSQVNSDLDTLYTLVNGNIENANIKSGAAISPLKIDGTAIVSFPSGVQTITNTTTFYATTFVSTTAGFFAVPRMTTVQRDVLYGLENGAMIYNTTVGEFQVREGGAWAGVTAAAVSAVSSLTAKGVSELATGTEAASSTPAGLGDTNAPLVLHAGISTSSPYIAGKYVPITENDGKLNQSFLDLTDSFTFASTTAFRYLSSFSATTTMATTTIASSTIGILHAGYTTSTVIDAQRFCLNGTQCGTSMTSLLEYATTTEAGVLTGRNTVITENYTETITTGFRPKIIRLNYYIQGHTSSASTNVYHGQKGTATWNGTTLLSNNILYGGSTATACTLAGDQGAITVGCIYALVNDSNLTVGVADGNNADIKMTLSISAISDTGFTVLCASDIGAGTNTSNGRCNASWEAYR